MPPTGCESMVCPQCGFDNPAPALFCGGCGSALGRTCSRCDFVNPAGFSFCGSCGQRLEAPAAWSAERSGLIERHLPPLLRERGLAQRSRVEGERRQITVLFCDMADFTAASERIGPERVYAMMERIYEILIRAVNEYEGTVNELTGDGIMAFFGAPVALEDAPQRAIRSALAIHRDISRYNEEAARGDGDAPSVSMRVGINTGPVVVGTLGADLRIEFKAVGDTVNLASRLEQMAAPGSTLVTAETFGLTEGLFRFEALGRHSVKGKDSPVPVYRVIAPAASRSRFEASAQRGLTRFVGRERELEILLDGYQRARNGRGQAVSITAEAGLGKSRLLYEFRSTVSSEDVLYLEGRCLSYCRGLAYYPLVDLLRSSFGVAEGATKEDVEARVMPILEELGVDDATTRPWLVELLAGPASLGDKAALAPEARKAQLTRALTEFLLTASERRPVVVAIEDLHWIDHNSEELLGNLLNNISGSRILMLLTYRPEYPHTWGARSYHSQLTLNRLSNRETLLMARYQLGDSEIDEPLADLILEKTEGVPFFVEEFLKSLRDLGVIEQSDGIYRLTAGYESIAAPTTIQDVLRARVDLLPDSAKELLKTASVVGREISHEMLQQLTDVSEETLLTDLSTLKDAELFYERGVYPHSTYLFKHALTREVVHDSLLHDQRRRLHLSAGNAIEMIHRSNLGEHHGVLAEHFMAGEDFDKAAEYSRLAARGAHEAGAGEIAIEYAQKSVSCIARLPESDHTLTMSIDAHTALAGYVLYLGRPHEARKVVAPIMDAALSLDDHSSWPAIFASVGLHELFATEDYASAMQHLEKVLDTPVDNRSAAWHWFAAYYLGAFHNWNCEFDQSIHYLEKAKAMSEAAGRLEGISVARSGIGMGLAWQGRLDEASDEIERALVEAGSSHNPTSQALAQAAVGIVRSAQGFHSQAKTHLLKGMKFTGDTAQTFWRSLDLGYLGDTLLNLGDTDGATNRYRESLAVLEPAGLVPSWQNVIRLKQARAVALGDGRGVRIDELRDWRRANRLRLFEGLTARLIAQILLAYDDTSVDEAREWIAEAMAADRANGLDLDLAHDYTCFAEIHRRSRDRAAMTDALDRARTLFEKCGARGFLDETVRQMEQHRADPAS